MKKFIASLMIVLGAITFMSSAKPQDQTKEVTFLTNMHCKNCQKKIEENISFEKGVTDLKVILEKKTVKITYNPSKTSVEKLSAALKKLGYTVELVQDKSL